jgi:hypothetical protein
MDNFDEKVSAALNNPEMMEKIMLMARSLGGGEKKENHAENVVAEPEASPLAGILGDPAMMGNVMRLLGAYQKGGDPKKAAVLQAVKPYLRPERQQRVDRALQTLKLASVAREAFGSDIFGGKS